MHPSWLPPWPFLSPQLNQMALVCPSFSHRTRDTTCNLPLCFLLFWNINAVAFGISWGCASKLSQRFVICTYKATHQHTAFLNNLKCHTLLKWQVCEVCHQIVISSHTPWSFSSNQHSQYVTKQNKVFFFLPGEMVKSSELCPGHGLP